MRYFLLLTTLVLSLFAKEILPVKEIKFDGAVKDLVVVDGKLIVGTDSGKMLIYSIKDEKIIDKVQLPKIKDFMGDTIDTRVSSVDFLNGKYLLISDSGHGGYFNVWIYHDGKLEKVISQKEQFPIVKAKFIDDTHILLGFLSNELALYDIKNKKLIYKIQLSESKFSDFTLSEDKKRVASSCESGIIYITDTKSGKVIKELNDVHVDNVYKVDFKSNTVSGAGQDRRGSIFDVQSGKGEYLKGNFLIYATGLSPDASLVAFAMDEQNNIYIYDTLTKSLKYKLIGQKSTLNNIIFIDNNTLFSASDDDTVMIWKLN